MAMTLWAVAVRVVTPMALETPIHTALGTPPLDQVAMAAEILINTALETSIHTALKIPTHMALGIPPGQEATAATMTALVAIRRVIPWLASSWRRQVACSRAIVW